VTQILCAYLRENAKNEGGDRLEPLEAREAGESPGALRNALG
jgi:hypothetical protein